MGSDQYQFNFDELDELYREVILDHYRNPRNKISLASPDIEKESFNPFCGDDIVIQIKISESGTIEEIGFQGQGCSISQSSASMLTSLVKNQTIRTAMTTSNIFTNMMQGHDPTAEELDKLGDLEVLSGFKKFPVRIKCALLAWATLEEAIEAYNDDDSS